MPLRVLLILSCLIFISTSLTGQVKIHINEWINKGKPATLLDILTEKRQQHFLNNPLEDINKGFIKDEIWLQLIVDDQLDQSKSHVLSLQHPSLADIDLYRRNQDGQWEIQSTGQAVPPYQRDFKDSNPHFLMTGLSAKDSLYLRVQTNGSISLPISLNSLSEYSEYQSFLGLLIGVFTGLMLVMSIYNFILYLYLKDSIYLLYVGGTFFGLCTSLVLNGYGYLYLWPDDPQRDSHIYLTFAGLSMVFTSRFAAEFLKVKGQIIWACRFLWIVTVASSILALLSLFFPADELLTFGRLLVLVSFPGYLIIGIQSFAMGNKSALFYVLAWSPYVIGLVLVVLRGAGVVGEHLLIAYGIEIGGGMEATLLSLALGYRIRNMRLEITQKELEKEQFKMKLLEDQSRLLERQVAERTEELTITNQTKDKFFSIIAHDLRGPMIALQGVGEKLDFFIRRDKKEKLLAFGKRLDSSIDHLNHLLNNLLNWASAQTSGIPYHPERTDSKKLIEEMVELYKGLAEASEVNINVAQLTELEVYADRNAASTIIRNVLSNAVKFSDRGGTVTIANQKIENHYIVISIADHGRGMDHLTLQNLDTGGLKSSNGSRGEQGFGLGLKLALEFAKQNKGQLTVESRLGVGSTFRLTLPSVHKHRSAEKD